MASAKRVLGFSLVSIMVFVLLTSSQLILSDAAWPTEEWAVTSPFIQQMNGLQLNRIDDYIENWNDEHQLSHMDQLVVIRNGYLIKEWYSIFYDAEDIHPLWSVTKSFICTLMGIAIEEGFIPSVSEYVLDYFSDRVIANVDSRKEAMTIEHLLMMSTGLDYPGDDLFWAGWMNSDDQVQYALDQPMATDPGTIYNYDTSGSHLISAIIQEATGMNTSDFAEQYLFDPLGITHYYWQKDKQGIAFGGHGLYLTPEDMAKLGYLYINNGFWDGVKLLPDNWTNEVTQTHWYFNGDWGYAKQWWTHPYQNGFSTQGRYGQSVFVFPEHEIIVVFTGTIYDSDPNPYLQIIHDYVFAAINTPTEILMLEFFIPITVTYFAVSIIALVRLRKNINKKRRMKTKIKSK
ncbi:MAG: serine hydrolase [Asgard group archaeon]|nr:serine hydrolase [Asgard group archaeon]